MKCNFEFLFIWKIAKKNQKIKIKTKTNWKNCFEKKTKKIKIEKNWKNDEKSHEK